MVTIATGQVAGTSKDGKVILVGGIFITCGIFMTFIQALHEPPVALVAEQPVGLAGSSRMAEMCTVTAECIMTAV